jgi:hypothetical protein
VQPNQPLHPTPRRGRVISCAGSFLSSSNNIGEQYQIGGSTMKTVLQLALLCFTTVLLVQFVSSQTVYVTKSSKCYHSEGCSSLRRSAIPMDLAKATERYSPCSRCRPPTMSASTNGASFRSSASSTRTTSSSGRCQATTKKGTQRPRRAQSGSNYCWQHKR